MLGDAAADIVPRDHHGPFVVHRVEEAHEPGGQSGDRRLGDREFAPGPSETRKIDGDRTEAGGSDVIERRLPDAAPIGAVEQQHQRTALARRQVADRAAVDIDGRARRHRTSLLTWSFPRPTDS
jgi:hypothetical protein